MPTLARINVTPMKGTALQHVLDAELNEAGISGNRRFFLVDQRDRLRSGIAHGRLVQVAVTCEGTTLTCRFPDGVEVSSTSEDLGAATVTDFYGRSVPGHVVEGPFGEAFSAYVGETVRLIRTDRDGDGPDELPLTLVSLASVEELGRRGDHPRLDPLRFRINLEIEDSEPFEEDTWDGRQVRIGGAMIRIAGQIPRCAVTTQDPRTGLHDWNTLKQIARFRPLMEGREVPFGVYATVVSPGRVRTGDAVSPLDP
jgi:uncharacterized protein YcbX